MTALKCDLRTASFLWNKATEKERIGVLTDAFRDIREETRDRDEISNTVILFGSTEDFDSLLETFEETPDVKNRVCNSIMKFLDRAPCE